VTPRSRLAHHQAPARDRGLLVRELRSLREEVVRFTENLELRGFAQNEASARNLLHYLALRRVDLRRLQEELADLGLSSLGRSEGHTLHNLDAVLAHLRGSGGRHSAPVAGGTTPQLGRSTLDRRTRTLLGTAPVGRRTRIMVTLSTEASTDYNLVRSLVAAGMNAARINCAHDDAETWARMIEHVRRAAEELHLPCRIQMDLGGPKLRTGGLAPGPAVLKIRPHRNEFGRVTAPARVWLTPVDRAVPAPPGFDATLLVEWSWLRRLRVPSLVHLTDARGARRRLRLRRRSRHSCELEVPRTVYLTNSTVLRARTRSGRPLTTVLTALPRRESAILVKVGDRLRVVPESPDGAASRPLPGAGRLLPQVSCTLPEALRSVRVGHRVWFDDGKIGTRVEHVDAGGLRVRVTHAPPDGARLRADKGINLPDSEVETSPLTDEDRANLPFVAAHADLVGYSFVRAAADVALLRRCLAEAGRPRLGIVLKIETRRAFEELPAILLEALRGPPVGVMIARGDLAVEVGYERLAEVQEEILWLCEAAHLPVVWATEVLAGLAKSGIPTRAEVTDAAMGARAECVMLNKGPHIVETVRALDNILRRMEAHQEKKSARLRHLAVADRFFQSVEAAAQPNGPSRRPR